MGPVFLLNKETVEIKRQIGKMPSEETIRLEAAISEASTQISLLCEELISENHEEEAAVFNAHIMLLKDKSFHKKVNLALERGINAEAAWFDSVEVFACQLENISDPTLCLRAADLRDVGHRVLRILSGKQNEKVLLSEPSIIIADDLTPSETVSLEKGKVLGFCTAFGGATSHTAILAKALGIPAVVNLGEKLLQIKIGATLLLNGNSGEVIFSPDKETESNFANQMTTAAQQANLELEEAFLPALTIDGHHVEIVANIGNSDDAASAIKYGAEGVGLLRTEFLFLERNSSPTEEEQLLAYENIFSVMGNRPVVVKDSLTLGEIKKFLI